jgi:ribosomal protein L40E
MRVDSREGSAKTSYKFEVTCLACKKPGERVLEGYMFNLVSDLLLAMAQAEPVSEQQLPVKVGICPTCGFKIPADSPSRFCNNCGQELACSTCGTLQPAGATTCKKCGSPVRPGRKMASK